MPQYCNSTVLERNWFEWIVADAVPALEPYRKFNILWTKCLGHVRDAKGSLLLKGEKPLLNPSHPVRAHYIAVGKGISLISDGGEISYIFSPDATYDTHLFELDPTIRARIGFEPQPQSDSEHLERWGYFRERPAATSWQSVLCDIFSICRGVASKFSQQDSEKLDDLANEMVLQVANKMKRGRLVYTPGRAPVFNLITTTVHRCMFSTLSRDQRRSRNLQKYAENAIHSIGR